MILQVDPMYALPTTFATHEAPNLCSHGQNFAVRGSLPLQGWPVTTLVGGKTPGEK